MRIRDFSSAVYSWRQQLLTKAPRLRIVIDRGGVGVISIHWVSHVKLLVSAFLTPFIVWRKCRAMVIRQLIV